MRHTCALFLKAVVILAVYAVCYAGDKFGFDSQQGFIPNDCPGCRVQVDIPGPSRNGMIIELDAHDAAQCAGVSEWRVSEYQARQVLCRRPHSFTRSPHPRMGDQSPLTMVV